MKTTIDIADSLFREARACAESRGVPFRQVGEEGLRAVIGQSRQSRKPFRLRDGSFGGREVHKNLSWSELRQAIYEGRGE